MKYGVISLVLCISTHLRFVTILMLLVKDLVILHADPCNKSYIYISRKISIEHPGVGLALLAKLEKWFPLQGELAQTLKKFYVYTLGFKNKIERRKRKRQNNNRPISLPQGNNIVHILRVHHLTLNFIIHNKYISTLLYIYTYINTYIIN